MNVPRWLRGAVSTSPHGRGYVRVSMENNSGTRAEVYITRKQALDLHEGLGHTLTYQKGQR